MFSVRRVICRAAAVGLALLFALSASAETPNPPRLPPPSHWLQFGSVVDASSDTLVVGAPDSIRNNDASNCSIAYPGFGAVGVYTKNATGAWVLSQELWHDPFAPTDTTDWEPRFGASVSLRGNTLVVGAERLNQGTTFGAGAFYVFQRSSSAASFSRLGPFYSPTPTAGARLTEVTGVVTNGTYVATYDRGLGALIYYRIQGSTVSYVGSIALPVQAPTEGLFISDNSVLVAMISGYSALLAYRLDTTPYTTIDTSSLSDGSVYTRPAAGSGNTFVSNLNGDPTRFRVVTFSASAVSSTQTLTSPTPSDVSSPSPIGIGIKEGSGIYVSFAGGTYVTAFLSAGYNLVGTLRPTQILGSSASSTNVRSVAFNGTDLFLGNSTVGTGGSCAANLPSTGAVNWFLAGGLGVAIEVATSPLWL